MNNLIISGYHTTQDCVTVTARRNGQTIQIPIPRKDIDTWLHDNERLWTQTVLGWRELTVQEYWFESIVLGSEQLRDISDYITCKGLVGDPFKDTFTALQSICAGYKRSKDIFLEEQEKEAVNSEASEYDFYMQNGCSL